LRLFHASGSRSDRILWLCEELGIPIEVIPVGVRRPTEEMLALNPAGSVPVLQLDDGTVITESVAALLYLANKHSPGDLAVDPAEPGYADFLHFTLLGEAGLMAPMSGIVMTRERAPELGENFTTEAIAEKLASRWALVERRLATGVEYLAADRFTVADISVGWAVAVVDHYVSGRTPPAVLAYGERMRSRPAYQKIRFG